MSEKEREQFQSPGKTPTLLERRTTIRFTPRTNRRFIHLRVFFHASIIEETERDRILVGITERRGLPPNHRHYRTREGLKNYAKGFDRVLTAVQRAIAPFGNTKAPNSLSIEIDKAKSLRSISETLTGILDTMRYQVCSPMLRIRLHIVTYSFCMLIRIKGPAPPPSTTRRRLHP